LPTEAEWEYAARAGNVTARFWGNDPSEACRYANVYDRTGEAEGKEKYAITWAAHDCDDGFSDTAPAGSFQPNALGLYDMLGNVWEWAQDCWHEDYQGAPVDGSAWLSAGGGDCTQRGLRGGAWYTQPRIVRSATRYKNTTDYRHNGVGFRLAQDL
jgi:formylglycine-generating enzyme required for sulfatase activity